MRAQTNIQHSLEHNVRMIKNPALQFSGMRDNKLVKFLINYHVDSVSPQILLKSYKF